MPENTSIAIEEGTRQLADFAFCDYTKLVGITIPQSVVGMGEYTFSDCSNLESLVISKNLSTIEDYTFAKCEKLSTFEIPDSVKYIGEAAFWDCINLESVTIGKNVDSIGEYAFYECSALSQINSYANVAPKTQGDYVFFGVDQSACVLNVPVGSKGSYETAANWKDFYNIVEKSELANINVQKKSVNSAPIYNMRGMRMDGTRKELQKGVYIQNGSKFIVE